MGLGSAIQLSQEEEKKNEPGTAEEKKLLPLESSTSPEKEEGPPPPPDGGWGWVIVAASFLCNMVLDGIAYSFGIFLKPLQKHFEGESTGTISLVGSILAGFIMLVGPISSILVNKFGPRVTCIAGACVSSAAIFLSTYSPNVYMLMISYGVVGGFGLGLMYVPAVTAVGYWFEKKRSLVTGISTCGSGFGTIVFAPVVTALLSITDWQWTNRIIAGFCLMCTLLGLTMKPVPKPANEDEDSLAEIKKENASIIKKDKAFNASKEEMDFIDNNEESNKVVESRREEEPEVKTENGYLTVLKNPPFFLVMLSNLPAVMGLYIPYMYLPGITQQRGITPEGSALLISLIGFFNTGGRIVSGAVTDHPKVDALFMTFLALLIGSVCPLLMTWCFDFWSYTFACILFGISLSAWPAVTSSMLVELLGLQLLTSAYGVLTCMRGAGAFLGPPLGGFILDAVGPRGDITNSTWPIVMDGQASEAELIEEMNELPEATTTVAADTELDLKNYEVAFYVSTLLLGISAVGHGFAFCVKKAQQNKKRNQNFAEA